MFTNESVIWPEVHSIHCQNGKEWIGVQDILKIWHIESMEQTYDGINPKAVVIDWKNRLHIGLLLQQRPDGNKAMKIVFVSIKIVAESTWPKYWDIFFMPQFKRSPKRMHFKPQIL